LNSPNYTSTMMHHGKPLHYLTSWHMQKTSMGGAKALFCRIPMEACEARRHGSDRKQRNKKLETQLCKQKSGRESFGGATPWSMRTQSSKGAWSALEKDEADRASEDPRPAGLTSF
jgi:hypothetical protein